jgi:HAD superfamily hydrolase (TIGR01509 family)
MEFDAILFDFDGVLADTEPIHFACWAEALVPLGVTFDWDYFRDHCVGMDDRAMMHLLAGRSDPPRDWETLWARYPEKNGAFRSRTLSAPPFAPGLAEFLARLNGEYKLAVVTASARAEIEPLLAAGGLDRYFDALVCGREAGLHKPAPDPYLRAASLLDAKKPLVVEDSAAGIASGRAAGFEVLAVASAARMMDAVQGRLAGPPLYPGTSVAIST